MQEITASRSPLPHLSGDIKPWTEPNFQFQHRLSGWRMLVRVRSEGGQKGDGLVEVGEDTGTEAWNSLL